ncbi:ABC transporter substrate-binding protein [Chryseolinea sp. T2]|uniref:heme/hemin ABC transporter substrate-binding protein n=1 Tax=Chryseolinea sp. T2 TaxID=3129255 RepID=UPI0030780FD7
MLLRILLVFTCVHITTVTKCLAQERIITAGSALTETVCALGNCDQIIASDRTSLYPSSIQKLPSIGYRTGISAEGIISLKPTMVIAEKEYVDDAVLSQLRATQIKLVIVDRKQNWEDTKKFIRQIATALHKGEEGEKLITTNESQLAESANLLKKTSSTPKVLCVYNRGTSTVSTAGKDTFGDITQYIGATNAFGGEQGYKPLNTEALIASNPDYLLLLSSGYESIGGLDGVLKIPGVAQTTAGKKRQVIAIDALRLTNFGPRFGETVKELVVLLHPELKTN